MRTESSDDAVSNNFENSLTQNTTLHRKIGWQGAFWLASGVPALVLFSIGAISATVGRPAWVIWTLSITFGFIQAFTYAEIAGLFPHKSGGASIYSAVAWVRYSKFIASVSVWSNWFAWSPVLAIGSGLAAAYTLNILFQENALINTWQITLLDLGIIKQGLVLRINATFILGVMFLLSIFAVQHGGILRSVKVTKLLGLIALFPLLLIAVVPLLTGDVLKDNFFPLAPLAYLKDGSVVDGEWNIAGWKLMAGGFFIAAWSSYGFETALCYTRELKNPKADTFKAIMYSGVLCLAAFILVPMTFQSNLGLGQLVMPVAIDALGVVKSPAIYDGMLEASIYNGTGVASIFSAIVGGGVILSNIVTVMLILTLLLAIMTSMSGSSRTLYQASVDGFLPKYLSGVNEHGAPTKAMWTDLVFNLILLLMSDYVFVLAASNVGYIIFNFLALNSGWIHRMDRPNWQRPYRAPYILILLGVFLGYLNLTIMGLGADVWGEGTLKTGLFFTLIVAPLFFYRHYYQDKGIFPIQMQQDLQVDINSVSYSKHLQLLPYLAVGLAVVLVTFTYQL